MDAEQIACYRTNYDRDSWKRRADEYGQFCVHVGAVYAVNALCDEVERLTKQRDELLAALEKIGGVTLSQFMGPHDMASACVYEARAAIIKEKDVKRIGTNTGHGHVWDRPDGVKARCGGPKGGCVECLKDAAMKVGE